MPPPIETLVERKIREAAEQGAFDDLEGSGRPLPILEEPYEENWWLKRFVQREGVSLRDLEDAGVLDRWRRTLRRGGGGARRR